MIPAVLAALCSVATLVCRHCLALALHFNSCVSKAEHVAESKSLNLWPRSLVVDSKMSNDHLYADKASQVHAIVQE